MVGLSFCPSLTYLFSAIPQGLAMAINGLRNKPLGPGGSTRRLHHSPQSGHGGEIGSTGA